MIRQFEVIRGHEFGGTWISRIQFWVASGDNTGEFSMRWYPLYKQAAPKLEVYNDAWYVLFNYCQDLLQTLSRWDKADPTAEQIVADLLTLGFEQKE